MSGDVYLLYTYLFAIWVSSLLNCLFKSSAHLRIICFKLKKNTIIIIIIIIEFFGKEKVKLHLFVYDIFLYTENSEKSAKNY